MQGGGNDTRAETGLARPSTGTLSTLAGGITSSSESSEDDVESDDEYYMPRPEDDEDDEDDGEDIRDEQGEWHRPRTRRRVQ